MELLILIPLGLLVLLLWAAVGVWLLRRRVGPLEEQVRLLAARTARLECEREAARSLPAAQAPAAARRVEPRSEPAAATGTHPAPARAPAPAIAGLPPTLGEGSVVPEPIGTRTLPSMPSEDRIPATPAVVPAARPSGPPLPPPRPLPVLAGLNWEQFMGVKLFAWVGGFALFLAVAFFVKYSFDQGWVSPTLRVACGFLTGLGLLVGGVLLKRKEYAVTAHALCGTGVVILYAVSFAARRPYELIGDGTAFALMVLVTVTAFLLAVRLPAMVVAVLGLLGGFLTPPLLSTGVDNPLGLFGYIAILDVGLVAVALKRRWHFLVAMAAVGTVLMEFGWAAEFFTPGKVFTALAVFAGFNALFLGAVLLARRSDQANDWMTGAAVALPLVTFAFTFGLIGRPDIAARPGVLFAFLLAANLPLLTLAVRERRCGLAQVVAGAATFLVLAVWTAGALTAELLNWALGGYLGFAVLHTLFPVLLNRMRPGATPLWLGHLFPPVALLLVMLPMARELAMPWLLWPVVLLVDVLAIGLALCTGAILGVLAMVVLTAGVAVAWLAGVPAEPAALPELLLVAGGFGVFFFFIGLGFGERMLARLETGAGATAGPNDVPDWMKLPGGRAETLAMIPGVSAILPFLLLVLAVGRLPLENPTPVFGLALVLVALLLALAHRLRLDVLAPVALGCVLALEYVWFRTRFTVPWAGATVAWNVAFAGVLTAFPFVYRAAFADRLLPWVASALAGPLHFFLVYPAVKQAWPNEMMGLLPAAFAVPVAVALVAVVRAWPAAGIQRTRLLAWFGGSTLFFVTLIFPIQFDKQWLTVAWALEGASLLWLFHRVPHPGLRATGVVLLTVAFARLALNPAVFDYHPRTTMRVWNWFLYGYGSVLACLLWGARLLAPPRERVFNFRAPPVLRALAAVLGFLLLNIEIADWFSPGASLTFDFNASLGQDMTYSIAWGLYAFLILAIGFKTSSRAARYAGMGLFVVTIVKLFLHDLWRLGGLYRIGSLIGLAVVLMVVSFIYQRFLAATAAPRPGSPEPGRDAGASPA